MLGRWDDCPIDPTTQRIILNIVGFYNSKTHKPISTNLANQVTGLMYILWPEPSQFRQEKTLHCMQYKITEWITAGYLAILKDKKEKKTTPS